MRYMTYKVNGMMPGIIARQRIRAMATALSTSIFSIVRRLMLLLGKNILKRSERTSFFQQTQHCLCHYHYTHPSAHY